VRLVSQYTNEDAMNDGSVLKKAATKHLDILFRKAIILALSDFPSAPVWEALVSCFQAEKRHSNESSTVGIVTST
jgi:hypothetical protein